MRDRNQSKQVNHVEGRMSCAQMHDDETAELVYRLDGDVAKLFGYTAGCCRPHPNSRMPLPVLDFFWSRFTQQPANATEKIYASKIYYSSGEDVTGQQVGSHSVD